MTATTETVSVVPKAANAPFNLILAPSRQTALKIAEHYNLAHVHYLHDNSELPASGPNRGEAISDLLDSVDDVMSLVALQDRDWLESLLSDLEEKVPWVWTAIQSRVLGHHVDKGRRFFVAIGNFEGDVREAQAAGLLRTFTGDFCVPAPWRLLRVPKTAAVTHNDINSRVP